MAITSPFQALELKFSAGTPIEEILKAFGMIVQPITEAVNTKRATMSQENRDRLDRLEAAIWENFCIALGLVRAEQLERPAMPFMPLLPELPK